MKETRTGQNVKRKIDLDAPLKPEQQARLQSLKGRKQIDYSDIPPVRDANWAHPGALSADNKQQVTLRLDSDVLAYFRGTGKRYQTRINQVLRAYMDAHAKPR